MKIMHFDYYIAALSFYFQFHCSSYQFTFTEILPSG